MGEGGVPGADADAVKLSANGAFGAVGDSPIEVREKVHASAPMTLEDALNQMEMVGHDFFLFHDSDTGQPSVVYRRRGWSYGVIHLKVDADEDAAERAATGARAAEGTSVGSTAG